MINSSGRKAIAGARLPLSGRKDRDDQDLLLFKELHKRDKDRIASLLQPVSEEFEPSSAGNYALYRISSGKKGHGFEFMGENDKNDYDWLKTPPATPMFPSLEMESNNPENVIQRELPIIQPRSRFAEISKPMKGAAHSLTSKPNQMPLRSVTPSQRSTISAPPETKLTTAKVVPTSCSMSLNQRMAQFTNDLNRRSNPQKEKQMEVPSSNISSKDAKTINRSKVAPKFTGFSNETPANLRPDRATSATRGRPGPTTTLHASASSNQKPNPTPMSRRQSCSPIVTRGRKQSDGNVLAASKGKSAGNQETQIFGSKMVDKVMNARRIGAKDREAKQPNTITVTAPAPASSGFAKITRKSSLDVAHKHTKLKRDQMVGSTTTTTTTTAKNFPSN